MYIWSSIFFPIRLFLLPLSCNFKAYIVATQLVAVLIWPLCSIVQLHWDAAAACTWKPFICTKKIAASKKYQQKICQGSVTSCLLQHQVGTPFAYTIQCSEKHKKWKFKAHRITFEKLKKTVEFTRLDPSQWCIHIKKLCYTLCIIFSVLCDCLQLLPSLNERKVAKMFNELYYKSK